MFSFSVFSKARDRKFGLSLHLHPYFVYVSSEGPGEPEHSMLANAISTKVSCAGPYIAINP